MADGSRKANREDGPAGGRKKGGATPPPSGGRPPSPARLLLRRLLPPHLREEVLGDLEEEWRSVLARRGTLRAGLFYARQAAGVLGWILLESVRSRSLLRGFRDDVRFAVRRLWRSPAFALLAVAVLGLGIGGSTVAFAAVDGLFLRPVPFADADRMVLLWRSDEGGRVALAGPPEARAWTGLHDVFEGAWVFRTSRTVLVEEGRLTPLWTVRAGQGLLDALGVQPVLGRTLEPGDIEGDTPRAVVLSHRLWQERFGARPSVLGREIVIGADRLEVVGVMPPGMAPPGWPEDLVDAWLPMESDRTGMQILALLREDVGPDEAERRLEEAVSGSGGGWKARAIPVTEFRRGTVEDVVRLLAVASLLLLAIALASVTMLALQRRLRGRRETVISAALGAPAARLRRLDVLEGLLVAVGAGAVGVLVAAGAIRVLDGFLPDTLLDLRGLRLGSRALMYAGAASLLGGAAIAFAPGSGARLDPAAVTGASPGRPVVSRGGATGLRWGLLVAEVAIAVALLISAGRIVGTFHELRSRDPGFDTRNLAAITVTLPEWTYTTEARRERAFTAMLATVAESPGVRAAFLASGLPPLMESISGKVRGEAVFFRGGRVSPGFLEHLGHAPLAGRLLRPGDEDAPGRPAVVGEGLARELARGGDPERALGRRISILEGEERTVVGVVRDLPSMSRTPGEDVRILFLPPSVWGRQLSVVFRTAVPVEDVLPTLATAVHALEPEALVEPSTAEENLAEAIAEETFGSLLMAGFAALSLLLAGAALYGLVSHRVGERTHEVGVRISLGASRRQVRWAVLRPALAATGTGLVVGAALEMTALRRVVDPLVTLVDASPGAYVVVALALVAAVVPAALVPAYRATRIDPARTLRVD